MTIGRRLLLAFVMAFGFGSGLFAQTDVPAGAPITLLEMPLRYQDWPERRSAHVMLELDPVRAVLSVFSEKGVKMSSSVIPEGMAAMPGLLSFGNGWWPSGCRHTSLLWSLVRAGQIAF